MTGHRAVSTVTPDRIPALDALRGFAAIEPGWTMQQGCSVLAVSALDAAAIETARRLLVTAVGTGGITGSIWYQYPRTPLPFLPAEGLKITHRGDWGTSPYVAEGVSATLTLPFAPGAVRVWALDQAGERRTPVPVRSAGDRVQFDASGAYRTFWHEVEVTGGAR